MASTQVSRLDKISREKVWSIVVDLEAWPSWAPENARNRILRHVIVSREDNVVICDEVERAWLWTASHRDRYTLVPQTSLEEIILHGDLEGGFTLRLKDDVKGTLVEVESEIAPRKLWPRIVSLFLGNILLKSFWTDLLEQLADNAEN